MADIVVDTSVVVKWYLPEQHHEAARALRDSYLEGEVDLVAPELLPFEAINALRYSGHFDGEQLAAAARSLSEYGIDLVSFNDAGPVADIATDLDITVYDAAYVALAERRDTTAYTADETLLNDLSDAYDDRLAHIRTYSS
ncbi:MAG: putative nucleic acid-binding protein, contains PIN domain protein [Halonotius sp. J07HN6]|jgi:Predicted nucleic acid-binding protein, contains PIN domain|nr:MAG: putative nucleic acid-binding protein, contains PIN domain protein [Halonotius sp. J07HN6]